MSEPPLTDRELSRLESDTFKYFADEINLENGLVPDNTRVGAPSSIAAVGFALTAYPIAVERKYLTRAETARCPATREASGSGKSLRWIEWRCKRRTEMDAPSVGNAFLLSC